MKLKTLVFVTAILIILAGGVAAAGAWWIFQPAQPQTTESSTFEVTRGSGQARIASNLAEQGFIKTPWAFRLAVKILGVGENLQAGVYQISPSENVFEIANRLTKNTNDLRVTIPEGLRAEEVVETLAKQLNVPAENAEVCLSQNGYLFPETYSFVPGTSLETACQRLRNQFDEQWAELTTQTPAPNDFTQAELVTLAALVQREAKRPEDMRRVAGVLFNRVDLGMPLQIDATLQYAKGYDANKKTWWPTPLAADKAINSPYNTYQNAGLPAGPISNPGQDALTAVLNPIASDDLYYISTLDGSEMFFTETYQEHMQNIDRYLR